MASFSRPLDPAVTIPGLQSVSTLKTVQHLFGGDNAGGKVVFAVAPGQRLDAADAATVAHLTSRLSHVAGVGAVVDPFAAPKETGGLSDDGRVGYISVQLQGKHATPGTERAIRALVASARSDRLDVEATSGIIGNTSTQTSQLPGLAVALLVLLITFGALVAAGLPLLAAGIGLGVSVTAIYASSGLFHLASAAPTLAVLLGLAVGIDYSLFVVNRHRAQLLQGADVADSIPRAVGTAGTAVFFAAATVIVALLGLVVTGVDFLTQMGLAAAFAVLVAMMVALTLTPALLSISGRHVLGRRARRRLRTATTPRPHRLAERWMSLVQGRPSTFLFAAVALVLVLAIPLLHMRLGLGNDGSQPSTATERKAYDLLTTGFGPGSNGPIELLVTYPATPRRADVMALAQTVARVADVRHVQAVGVKDMHVLLGVEPDSGPSDQATVELVTALRRPSLADHLPGSPRIEVTGETAVAIDISDRLAGSLPRYVLLVGLLACLILLAVFRSVLLPLKAAVTFILSLGAALGATVAVFQWGWLGRAFGVDPAGPVLAVLPTLVIGILFGLSMDYEMFIVTGMRERFAHGEPAREAVANGFRQGVRVVIAAALIMIGVFGNGVLQGDPTIRPIAFALAVGIIVDAFVVRAVLVPAVMTLFDRASWWLPKSLDRVLPDIDVEGATLPSVSTRLEAARRATVSSLRS